jgi:hypothetical protein
MVTLLVIASAPLVSMIEVQPREAEKTIVSPLLASAMAWRSDPTPASLQFVTLNVAAPAPVAVNNDSAANNGSAKSNAAPERPAPHDNSRHALCIEAPNPRCWRATPSAGALQPTSRVESHRLFRVRATITRVAENLSRPPTATPR